MSKLFQKYNRWFLLVAMVLSFSLGQGVFSQHFSQHQGHKMPASKPNASASPSPTPSPVPPPHRHAEMPKMQMPAASPTPTPEKMEMEMPAMQMPAGEVHSIAQPEPPPMGSMNMGPLLVMNGNNMGIRVGSSATNVMAMGAMGSGTSWQPSSAPMFMSYKQSGDWALMFHYNAVAGVNSQGGPRGVTKFESADWFMPMAYHRLGKGTLQLRGHVQF